jgi:hypothetical protein
MAGKDLTITLTAKDGTSTVFKQVGTEAERMGQHVTAASEKSSESMKRWSEAGRALGVTFAAVGILSSKLAGGMEASNARLSTSFQDAGLSIDDYRDKIEELTESGKRLAFDDEAVQDSLSTLTATTRDAEKAMRDVGVAEDLARARKIDLASATNIVNAAEAGRFRGLQMLGIVLGQNATSEEAIAALQQRFGGQAEAYSQTTAASYDRMKIAAEDYLKEIGGFVNAHGQVLLAIGGLATAAEPAAEGVKALSVAMKESAIAGAALDLALGPVGVALAVVAAGVALYELTQRETEAEKSTKALNEATAGYVHTIQDETTALANLGLLDLTNQMHDYLEAIDSSGLIAQKRLDDLASVQERLIQDSQLGGTREVPVWQAMVEGGFINDYTAQVLAANDANNDGRISADEYAAAQAALSAGFELTTTQATGLETAMTAVTKAVSDPQLFGRELGDRANQILQDMHNGVISVDDAIAQLNALPLDVTFNRAAAAAESATSSIDSMVDSLYGSATAFGAERRQLKTRRLPSANTSRPSMMPLSPPTTARRCPSSRSTPVRRKRQPGSRRI